MSHLFAVLVRLVVVGGALAAYYAALPYLFPDDGGGANIGAGLIAFGALIIIGFAWSMYDGWRRGVRTAIAWWVAISAAFAVAWWIALAAVEHDASMSFGEMLAADAGQVPFTLGLIAVPAVAGAAIGNAVRGTDQS